MFIVLLEFSENKANAGSHMQEHIAWVQRGFDDGIFLLAGSLKPDLGGAILADNTSLSDLQTRVNDDPFVTHNIVNVTIHEIAPAKTDARLSFLLSV